MMMKLRVLLLFIAATVHAGTVDVSWRFSDHVGNPQAVKRIVVTPLSQLGIYNVTNIVFNIPISKQTDSTGSLTVSNLANGYNYRVQMYDSAMAQIGIFTNGFSTNVTGLVYGRDYLSFTYTTNKGIIAYSEAQSDARFQPLSSNLTKWATIGTNALGSGGGVSTNGLASTNYVNTATNNVTTNLLAVIYNASNAVWSAQNTLSNYNRLALTWTTNKFAAQDATNSLKADLANVVTQTRNGGVYRAFVGGGEVLFVAPLVDGFTTLNGPTNEFGGATAQVTLGSNSVVLYAGGGFAELTPSGLYVSGTNTAGQFSGNGYNLTNLQASAIVGGFDSLTVTNRITMGDGITNSPEIKIAQSSGSFKIKNSNDTTLMDLDLNENGVSFAGTFSTVSLSAGIITADNYISSSGYITAIGNISGNSGTFNSLRVTNEIVLGESSDGYSAIKLTDNSSGFEIVNSSDSWRMRLTPGNGDFSVSGSIAAGGGGSITAGTGGFIGDGSQLTGLPSQSFGSVDATNIVSGTIALARYGFTPATNGAAIVYSQLPYQGLITNANGVNLTNISPANIISNGTFIVNGVLATNSGLTSGAFLSETGASRKYSNNGSSITNVVAAFVSGTLTNNTTGNAATATTLATSPTLTNVLVWGSSARSNNFEFSTAGLTMTNLVGITNTMFNSSTGLVFTVSGTNGSGSFRLNTNGAIYTTGITNTGSFTNSGAVMFGSTLTVGATTMAGSLSQSSGNVIPSAGLILNYFNQDCTLTRASAGTVLVTTNLSVVGSITAGSANISTNTAPYLTTSNPTNQFITNTLYTNVAQRSLLIGSAVLNSAVSGDANITLTYTNNGVGYSLPMQIGLGVAMSDAVPFCVPLSTNATFKFTATLGTGASAWITNCINWKQ